MVFTLSNAARASLFSPHLLVAYTSFWAISPLGVVVKARILWGFFVCLFVSIWVMLPSEIPKLPTDPLVRGFPGVWKLLLLHDSLPRMVSIPSSVVSPFIF